MNEIDQALENALEKLIQELPRIRRLKERIERAETAAEQLQENIELAEVAVEEIEHRQSRARNRGGRSRRRRVNRALAEEASRALQQQTRLSDIGQQIAEDRHQLGETNRNILGKARGQIDKLTGELIRRRRSDERLTDLRVSDAEIESLRQDLQDSQSFRRPSNYRRTIKKPSKSAFRRIRKYFSRGMLGSLIALSLAQDLIYAAGAFKSKGFTRSWLVLLADAINRPHMSDVNTELYKVIGYFTQRVAQAMPNAFVAEGIRYFQDHAYVEIVFQILSKMSTMDRHLLAQALRQLLNAPQTVSDPPRPRRTRPRIDRTPPKPRPATFPDKTDTELKDEIYMSRLRKAYWLRRLRYAGAQLRKAKFDDRFRDGADSTERKNLAEEAARIRERIRGYNERIKAYEKALKEPHRDKGPTRTYDPIKPEADLPTVEEAVLQMLSEKLERSIKELQKRDEQLKGAGSEEIEYINQLRRLMDKLDDEIGRLQEQIEFIERLRRQDRKTDEDLALGPMVTEPPDYSGADLAAELNGALRRGIDIWALARRHGLDLTKPATGVTGNAVTIPWEKSIYSGALIHDDLYGKVHASQGGPGTGDLVFRFRFGRDAGEGNFGPLDPGLVRRRTAGNLIPVRPFTPRLPVGASGNEAANIIDLSNGPLAPRRPFTPQHPRSA